MYFGAVILSPVQAKHPPPRRTLIGLVVVKYTPGGYKDKSDQ